jgi:hypothetical protein
MQERRENRKDAGEGRESRKGGGGGRIERMQERAGRVEREGGGEGGRVRGKIRPSSSEWETIPGREFLSLHTLKGGGEWFECCTLTSTYRIHNR